MVNVGRGGAGWRTGERSRQPAAPELLDDQALHQRGHRAGRAEAVAIKEELHCQRCTRARAARQPCRTCRSARPLAASGTWGHVYVMLTLHERHTKQTVAVFNRPIRSTNDEFFILHRRFLAAM